MSQGVVKAILARLETLGIVTDLLPETLAVDLAECSTADEVRAALQGIETARLRPGNDKPFGSRRDAEDSVCAAVLMVRAFSDDELSR